MIEIELLKWSADKLFSLLGEEKNRTAEAQIRIASFFDQVAECLVNIAADLEKDSIPYVHGNTLRQLRDSFEVIIASNLCGKSKLYKKETTSNWYTDIIDSLKNADGVDGLIINGSKKPKDKAESINNIKRTAGKFRGIAISFRAVGPFPAKDKKRGKRK